MTDLIIGEELAERLREIASREARTVEEMLRSMLKDYSPFQSSNEALFAMDGMFDDDITDLSSMTKDDVRELYRKKYAGSD